MAKKSKSIEKEAPCTASAGEECNSFKLCKEDTQLVNILLKGIYRNAEAVNNTAPLIMHIFRREMPSDSEGQEWGMRDLQLTTPQKGKDKLLATLDYWVGMKSFTANYHFESGFDVTIKLSVRQK